MIRNSEKCTSPFWRKWPLSRKKNFMKKLKKVIFGGGGGEMAGPQLYSNFVAPIREKSERSEKRCIRVL